MDIAVQLAEPTLCASTPAAERWRIFQTCEDGLYRFIFVHVGGARDVADDLHQQTALAAAQAHGFPSDPSQAEAYMKGIARNLIRLHRRKCGRTTDHATLESVDGDRRLVTDMERAPLPAEQLIREETRLRLIANITELSSDQQDLIFAHYFDGLSHAEVARKMGTTDKAIESKLYRARERLRELMRKSKEV